MSRRESQKVTMCENLLATRQWSTLASSLRWIEFFVALIRRRWEPSQPERASMAKHICRPAATAQSDEQWEYERTSLACHWWHRPMEVSRAPIPSVYSDVEEWSQYWALRNTKRGIDSARTRGPKGNTIIVFSFYSKFIVGRTQLFTNSLTWG